MQRDSFHSKFTTLEDYINTAYHWLLSVRGRDFTDAPIPGCGFHADMELWVNPLSAIDGVQLAHIVIRPIHGPV